MRLVESELPPTHAILEEGGHVHSPARRVDRRRVYEVLLLGFILLSIDVHSAGLDQLVNHSNHGGYLSLGRVFARVSASEGVVTAVEDKGSDFV